MPYLALTPQLLALALNVLAPGQELLPLEVEPEHASFWSENLRIDLDVSSRSILSGDGDLAHVGALGLDLHKVFSTDLRDLATFVLQPYLVRADGLHPTPGFLDDAHDTELQWRIFNGNVKLRDSGALNLRVGHFELPFGLEQTLDTNGTLRQYTHGANFGFKADWGATLNGEFDEFEYEFAWSRGGGNEYRSAGGDGVFSGRIGMPRDADVIAGLSFLDGTFWDGGNATEKQRVALDVQVYRRALGYFLEVAVGEEDQDTDVVRGIAEVNWRDAYETTLVWLQLGGEERSSPAGTDGSVSTQLGVQWRASQDWTLSTQVVQVLEPLVDDGNRSTSLLLQLRYRF